MNKLLLLAVAGVSTIALSGCGSNSNCGKVAACGGDVVGNWKIVDTCLSFTGASPFGAMCPTAQLDASGIDMSGTVSYLADMTYTANITLSGSMALVFEPSCLAQNNIVPTCQQLDQAIKNDMMTNPDPMIQSVSCSGSSTCRCTFVMAPQTETSTGTWSTSGTTLTQDGSPDPYCVKDGELHLSDMSMSMGELTGSGSIVLKKN